MAIKIKRIAAFAMCLLLVFGLFGLFMLVRKHEQEKEEVAAKEEYEQVTQNFRDRYFQNKDNLYLLWDGNEFPVDHTSPSYGMNHAKVNFRSELTVNWGDSQITNGGSEHIYTDNQRYHLIVVSGDIKQSDMQTDMFLRCTYLRKIAIPFGITSIPLGMCNESGLDEVIFSDNIKNIDSYAFCHNTYLETITLPESLTTLSISAFQLSGLKKVELPANVKMIGENAFAEIANLEIVRFNGSTPTNIGANVFANCPKLANIIVPRHEFVNYKACTALSAWNDKIVYE